MFLDRFLSLVDEHEHRREERRIVAPRLLTQVEHHASHDHGAEASVCLFNDCLERFFEHGSYPYRWSGRVLAPGGLTTGIGFTGCVPGGTVCCCCCCCNWLGVGVLLCGLPNGTGCGIVAVRFPDPTTGATGWPE